jgi:anti-anti-sigma factor
MLAIDTGADGTVVLTGRLDAAQAPAAQARLDALDGAVTVDLTGLEYISSAGLGVLLKTHKRLLGRGGKVCLIGLRPAIRDIFTYSGLDQIFEIAPAP